MPDLTLLEGKPHCTHHRVNVPLCGNCQAWVEAAAQGRAAEERDKALAHERFAESRRHALERELAALEQAHESERQRRKAVEIDLQARMGELTTEREERLKSAKGDERVWYDRLATEREQHAATKEVSERRRYLLHIASLHLASPWPLERDVALEIQEQIRAVIPTPRAEPRAQRSSIQEMARDLRECGRAHEGAVLLLGNVRADEIVDVCDWVLSEPDWQLARAAVALAEDVSDDHDHDASNFPSDGSDSTKYSLIQYIDARRAAKMAAPEVVAHPCESCKLERARLRAELESATKGHATCVAGHIYDALQIAWQSWKARAETAESALAQARRENEELRTRPVRVDVDKQLAESITRLIVDKAQLQADLDQLRQQHQQRVDKLSLEVERETRPLDVHPTEEEQEWFDGYGFGPNAGPKEVRALIRQVLRFEPLLARAGLTLVEREQTMGAGGVDAGLRDQAASAPADNERCSCDESLRLRNAADKALTVIRRQSELHPDFQWVVMQLENALR